MCINNFTKTYMNNRYLLVLLMALCSIQLSAQIKARHGRDLSQVNHVESLDEAVASMKGMKKVGSQATAPLKAQGRPKVPVILVQFQNLKFVSGLYDSEGNHYQCANSEDETTVNQFFDKFCNGNGDGEYFKGAGSFGAIGEYFRDQSDGQFIPEFVVIGPVTLDYGYEYYGKNSGTSKDVNVSKFYSESITKAQQIFSDWSQFDNDGNSVVDMAFFIFAGEGENGGGGQNTIWPHERPSGGTFNNVKFGCYACCNETYKEDTDGIGVFVHELSHALGLPDFYDKNYVAFGLDYYDIMDSGCYCDNAYTPCNYSSYERDFMGWKSLGTLNPDEPQQLTLYPVSSGGVGYKIENPEFPDEYLVIENRQPVDWDSFIGRGTVRTKMHGMMVTHVNYNKSSWDTNNVNINLDHQRISIVPADGTLRSYMFVEDGNDYNDFMISAIGDLFPGSQNVQNLTGTHEVIYQYYEWEEKKDPETEETLIDPETGAKILDRVYYTCDYSLPDFGQPLTDITENEDGSITLKYMGEPDAIASLFQNRKADMPVYNSMGMLVGKTDIEYGQPTTLPDLPGLYIINSHKYIVK